MKKRTGLLKSESGFTLLEIISVLVILGVLAAVAVPRYVSLQDDAAVAAAEAAVAEGIAQVNLESGRFILQNSRVPTTLAEITAGSALLSSGGVPDTSGGPWTSGDFEITFTDNGNQTIDISVDGVALSAVAVVGSATVPSVTGTAYLPQ